MGAALDMASSLADAIDADPANYAPSNEAELAAAMANPLWRLNHLYKIVQKEEAGADDDDEETGRVVTFKLNDAQDSLARDLWFRNIVPKARQRGITTFSCILALDYCLFSNNFQAGIIAHKEQDAKKIFRSKVRFAYERLPEAVKAERPLTKHSADELEFANGSSIVVSTSMRSGTINFLHISEYGKICARFPERATEIITGSLPAVTNDGIVIIESTAEGRDGDFYHKTMKAKAKAEGGKRLTRRDYRLHFFPWFEAVEYAMDPRGVVITDKDHDYFDEIEAKCGIRLSSRQRAWYVAIRDEDFSGNQQRMYQEFPSTVDECFMVSTEGCYYTRELAIARQQGRIVNGLPTVTAAPCWTFWDIGASDGTAIWVIQKIGQEWRCIRFYEAWGEPYSHAASWLQSLGLMFDRHFLPHDADHERQGEKHNKSPRMMLEDLMPGHRFEVVPRIEDVNWGIQQTRDIFPMLWFDETQCKEGIIHLEAYRKRWSEQLQTWSDSPDKTGGHSEAADALRQAGQAYADGMINISSGPKKGKKPRNWRTV